MKLFIISGLSGSGKSTVLHVLEDMGFFCVDNLPVGLLSSFAAQMLNAPEKFYENAAIAVDARNRAQDLNRFPAILSGLRSADIPCEVIFLNADTSILIKRFSETRRKHPLTNNGDISLAEAIEKERQLLEPISQEADLYLETSHTNLHQLRDIVKDRLNTNTEKSLSIMLQSFGFKHGVPLDADFVFDVRCLPNPYWEPRLRDFTGKDQVVVDYLENQVQVKEMLDDLQNYLAKWIPEIEAADRTYLTIAIGCTGGLHRSVYLVEKLAERFAGTYNILARHRELQ